MLTVEDSPLYSADFFADGDPWAYFAELRRNDPVSIHRRADGYEFYALTRYDDVYAAYVDHVRLSSSYGTMIGYRDEAYAAVSPLDSLVDAQLEVLDFIDDLIDRRIESGAADDMIGFLAQCVAEDVMPRDVALLNGLNVAVGGNETTPHTAS